MRMARDYSRIGFDSDAVAGFLLRHKFADAAQFVIDDSEKPSTSLFEYHENQMSFPAMVALSKGDTSLLTQYAESNPAAVRTFALFGHHNGGDLYAAMLGSGKPRVVTDSMTAIQRAFGHSVGNLIINGLIPKVEQELRDCTIAQIRDIADAVHGLSLTDEETKNIDKRIDSLIAEKLSNGLGDGPYAIPIKNVEELHKVFGDVRALLGEERGNQIIRSVMPHILRQQALDKGAYLSASVIEARRSGLQNSRIAEILMARNALGWGVIDDILRLGGRKNLQALLKATEKNADPQTRDAWLLDVLNHPRGVIAPDIDINMAVQYADNSVSGESPSKLPLSGLRGTAVDHKPYDYELLQTILENGKVHIPPVLEAMSAKSEYEAELAKKFRQFLTLPHPVMKGPSILAYVSPETMEIVIAEKARLAGVDKQALVESIIEDVSTFKGGYTETAMHRSWAQSRLLGPPGSENAVEESLSSFIVCLDQSFGTDTAVEMASRLFAVKNSKGRKPLEATLNDGPDGDYGRFYYPAMIKGLARALGDTATFERYMETAILPNLPPEFGGGTPPEQAAGKYLRRNRLKVEI